MRKRPKLCENVAKVSPMAQKNAVMLSLLEKVANDGVWEAQLFMAEHFALDKSERDKWRSAAWETMTETTTGSGSAEVSLVGENYPSLSASFLSSLVKAAEDDDHTAQLMLGRAYRTGVGKIVGKDSVKACNYLQATMAACVEEAKQEIQKTSQDLFEEVRMQEKLKGGRNPTSA